MSNAFTLGGLGPRTNKCRREAVRSSLKGCEDPALSYVQEIPSDSVVLVFTIWLAPAAGFVFRECSVIS